VSRTSILKRSLSAVAVLAALLSPANATYRQDSIAVFPDLSISAATDRAPIVLTSRLPWLAPVGHRQPHQADVPQQRSRLGMGTPATAVRPGTRPQADHLQGLLNRSAAIIPGRNKR